MHKSQFGGLIIDCRTDDLDQAAAFWSAALGLKAVTDPRTEEAKYRRLETGPEDLEIEVQKVDHESRVHIDIETDNIEAEATRLESMGAKRIARVHSWLVMEAPTGQRFCLVKPYHARFDETANSWG